MNTIPTAREAPPRVTAEELGERLGARRTGENRWAGRCPAHRDDRPSLSIRAGDDGRVLLHCHAGCTFSDVVAALGLEPRQLFPDSDRPWRPTRPRPDPERQVRELFERLRRLRRPPPPERMRDELRLVGMLLARGTAADGLGGMPRDFHPEAIRCYVLRVIYFAIVELARQRTPRRWFSARAIAGEIDHVAAEPGYARRLGVYGWCRVAVHIARACDALEERQEVRRG